uniref:Peptidase metallopeptidase domain-containing protein n=2 Tax=Physcomitrium patens TaxID=3218 RepID=A0A2K1KEN1_PHYPA|nr:hypothetical protein PHYPA_008610 [Physcomitrium patens]
MLRPHIHKAAALLKAIPRPLYRQGSYPAIETTIPKEPEQMIRKNHLDFQSPGLAALLCVILLFTKLVCGYEHGSSLDGHLTGPPPQFDDTDQHPLTNTEAHEAPQALEALKQYMQQYGYLNANRESTSPILKEMSDAIGLLQKSLALPVTKKLDAVTYSAVGEPRCGHPDYVQSRCHSTPRKFTAVDVINASEDDLTTAEFSNHGDHVTSENEVIAGSGTLRKVTRFAYFPGNPRWNSRFKLTWALSPSMVTQRLSRDDIRSAFTHAFQLWAATVSMFNFTEVQDYHSADVKICFVAGEHGDAQNFDGVLGIIAHAFSPEDGRVHFDDAEFWSVDVNSDKSPQALDLTSVAIHEVGHVIGLAHSPMKKSVMFPSISPRHTKRELSDDDVQGVRQLYGLAAVNAPPPHFAVDHANTVRLNLSSQIFLLFLNFISLMRKHV